NYLLSGRVFCAECGHVPNPARGGMKMGRMFRYEILEKAKLLGGKCADFKQEGGNCAGWVARWIRKRALSKDAWDPKYFNSFLDEEEGYVVRGETEAGTRKAESLMAVQRFAVNAAQARRFGLDNALELRKANLEISQALNPIELTPKDKADMEEWKAEI